MRNRGISRSALVYGIPAVFIAVVLIVVGIRIVTQQDEGPTYERSSATQPSGPGSQQPSQQPMNQPAS